VKEQLESFLKIALKEELEGTGIEMTVRSTLEGYEARFVFQEYAVLTISEGRLESERHPSATLTEAKGLVREMKRSLIEAGNGKSRFYEREES
jgi:hypothetical protein